MRVKRRKNSKNGATTIKREPLPWINADKFTDNSVNGRVFVYYNVAMIFR